MGTPSRNVYLHEQTVTVIKELDAEPITYRVQTRRLSAPLFFNKLIIQCIGSVAMSVHMNIERQPVILQGSLTVDPQCYTVTLAGDKIDLYPKEFDALCLLMKYPGWVLSSAFFRNITWIYSLSELT